MNSNGKPVEKRSVEENESLNFKNASEITSMDKSDEMEQQKNEKSEREKILEKLASIAISEGEGNHIMLEVARLKLGSALKSSKNFDNEKMTIEERKKLVLDDLRDILKPIPDSMMNYLCGRFRPGDIEQSFDKKPDWLDMEKLRRGQKFAQNYILPILYSELIALFALYSFESGLDPIISTGNTDTPFTAFKRYLSTALRFRRWYSQDSWVKGSPAWRDIMVVRAMHNSVSRKLKSSTHEEIQALTKIPNAWCPLREIMLKDFSEVCKAPVIGQCPYIVERNNPHRPKGISQTEMALTQWSFIGLIISYPKNLGIHYATDEDLEAFCHLWRSLGYQLGIEDEYNFCRGTLEEIRQRSNDFIETWIKPNFREITPEWEHMGRCLVTTMSALIPFVTYETTLLHLMEIINLRMPRVYASLSYIDRISFNVMSFLFYYGTQIPGVTSLLNGIAKFTINRAEKYTPKQLEELRIKLSNYNGNNSNNNNMEKKSNSMIL